MKRNLMAVGLGMVVGLGMMLLTQSAQADPVEWNHTTGGDWVESSNWNPQVDPNNVAVIFGAAITEASTVNLTENRTVTALTINNSNYAYTLDGPGTLTVDQGGGGGSISFTGANHDIKNNLTLTGATNFSGTGNISGNVHFESGAGLQGGGTVELSGALSGYPRFTLLDSARPSVTLTGTSTLTQQIFASYVNKMEVADGANISIDVGTGVAWHHERDASYTQTGGTVDLKSGIMQLGTNRPVSAFVKGGTLSARYVLVHTWDGSFRLSGGTVNLEEGILDILSRTTRFEFTGGTLNATGDGFQLRNLRDMDNTSGKDGGPVIQDATAGNSLLDLSGYNALFSGTSYTAAVSEGDNTATVRLGGTGKTLTLSGTDGKGNLARLTIGNQAFLVGEGTITGGGGVVITDGGTLAPGNSPGTMTIDDLEIASGGAARFDIWGTDVGEYDQIVGTNLILNDGWILELNFKRFSTGTYDLLLFNYDNVTGDEFTPGYVYLNGSSATDVGFYWDVQGGHLTFTSAIPEPGSGLLLLLGGLLMSRRRRR